ncbi:early activation antigen CD69 isoform X2 [Kryptolebias marmoratus]|uniref:early activation antigen CD69 isoform X2 n=1 Tax=Kryptolebias marmoratus TaxID=37003 RepID=UPI0007F8CF3E|nr:early activation antigen CD69 isoform X2 [Kryptolebias marmoratus]
MYIKFCRWNVEDKNKKDENSSAKLSVELEGEKDKQAGGNERLYRYGCLFLTVLCFILVLVIVILCMKLQTGSTSCAEKSQLIHTGEHNCVQQCAKGWILFGKSCFFMSTVRLTWAESQKNCSSSGGSLAVITTQHVQSFLTKYGNLKYWIGLRHSDNAWNWVNNTQLQQSASWRIPRHSHGIPTAFPGQGGYLILPTVLGLPLPVELARNPSRRRHPDQMPDPHQLLLLSEDRSSSSAPSFQLQFLHQIFLHCLIFFLLPLTLVCRFLLQINTVVKLKPQ